MVERESGVVGPVARGLGGDRSEDLLGSFAGQDESFGNVLLAGFEAGQRGRQRPAERHGGDVDQLGMAPHHVVELVADGAEGVGELDGRWRIGAFELGRREVDDAPR